MAALAISTMGKTNEDRKPIHPLFQKPAKVLLPQSNVQCEIQLPLSPSSIQSTGLPTVLASDTSSPSNSTSIGDIGSKEIHQPTSLPSQFVEQTIDENLLDVDPNEGRKKRRRTESPDDATSTKVVNGKMDGERRRSGRDGGNRKVYTFAPDIGISPGKTDGMHLDNFQPGTKTSSGSKGRPKPGKNTELPGSVPGISGALDTVTANPDTRTFFTTDTSHTTAEDKPKKLLVFNSKTGTIGSPPAKKPAVAAEKAPRGRPKKSQIVKIAYGSDLALSENIRDKIVQILNSPPCPRILTPNKRATKAQPKTTPTKKILSAPKIAKSPPKPGKPLHPLFAGKPQTAKVVTSPKAVPKTNIVDLTTPKRSLSSRPKSPTNHMSTRFPGFGPSKKIAKFPGALEPAWPWKDLVHTRGTHEFRRDPGCVECPVRQRSQKAKHTPTYVSQREDVLYRVAAELDVNDVLALASNIDMNTWPPPPESLRVPTKHLESGLKIQQRIRSQVHNYLPMQQWETSSEDELQPVRSSRDTVNPSLGKIYDLIGSKLSAYDMGTCETQTWVQKYCPEKASEVLQNGREASILKEWLQTLTVNSVVGGVTDRPKMSSSQKLDNTAKRKRKSKKTDDFIVSDGEPSDDLDEISDPENDIVPQKNSTLQKSVVRSAGRDSKLKNAVLISGPHGCGKTATVYAIAKELGFEVFEINSSSRRSGKDILEKVGDMTRNHLVQRQHNGTASIKTPDQIAVDESARIEQALADDISSGRQGTMNSFFKSKAPTKAKPSSDKTTQPLPVTKMKVLKDVPLFKSAPKEQKQSLILIEEVDIIYEEDKQFWITVLSLILSSKRPIIMTCNDESAIQADLNDCLHAILRLCPPATDLATDYMLLVAAAEGHLLGRAAIKDLYEGRNHDLRASINELQFWCQFAVGDQKHGGDWYYRRQAGADLDDNGHRVRVVSEGTYSSGLGWVSEDHLTAKLSSLALEEEMLQELWQNHELDAGDWQSHLPLAGWAAAIPVYEDPKQRLAALENYQDFTECMSMADVCSDDTFASEKYVKFDASHPLLPTKALDDFPLGRRVLQAPLATNHHPLAKHISICMRSQARSILHTNSSTPPLPARNVGNINSLICRHIAFQDDSTTRLDLCIAFDPISFSPVPTSLSAAFGGSNTLEPSVFDRTMSILTTEVAPYVRGIVSYESRLQQYRLERSGQLLSSGGAASVDGGGRAKKARTTRSAMSALEGGTRSTTRRERWFDAHLNAEWVFKTGGEWGRAVWEEEGRRRDAAIKAILAAQALANANANSQVQTSEQVQDCSRVQAGGDAQRIEGYQSYAHDMGQVKDLTPTSSISTGDM